MVFSGFYNFFQFSSLGFVIASQNVALLVDLVAISSSSIACKKFSFIETFDIEALDRFGLARAVFIYSMNSAYYISEA